MKIFLICSKAFYDKIPDIKTTLEKAGHVITLPNCFDDPQEESRHRGTETHAQWKSEKIKHSTGVIEKQDAVLVLNFKKNDVANYVGGATFLEMYDAFRLGKNIFLLNDIPEGILKDEIIGFAPVLLNGNLSIVI